MSRYFRLTGRARDLQVLAIIAGALTTPWNRTNQKFAFTLDVLDADGERIGDEPAAFGDLEQGWPPGLRPGTPQRIVFAFPIGIEFAGEGRYVFHVYVDERDVGGTEIEVMLARQVGQQPQPA